MDKELINTLNKLREKNLLNEAVKILNSEKVKNPKNLEILFQLGGAYRSLGNFKAALENYNEILIHDETFTAAYRMIGTIINHKDNGEYIKKLEKLIEKNNLSIEQKVDMYFSLGKAYEDLNEKNKSAKNYILANKYKKEITKYNFKIHKDHFDQIYEIFKNINFINKSSNVKNEKKVIFLCGLPRTGSTLFESILASHKEVYSGGELPYLQRLVKQYFAVDGKISEEKILDQLHKNNLNFNKDYYKILSTHNFSEKYITDKQLDNFRWIGLIKLFFPNSKIIICKRNYKANAISIFKNNFNSGYYNWTNDPEDIFNYIKYYNKFMNFWKKIFPNEFYEVEYEQLIKQNDVVIKKLLKFCELEWDPKCLLFYKNKHPIKTASAFQARQPIYDSSIEFDTVLFDNIFLNQNFNDI